MSVTTVTLEDVLQAAGERLASLAPETSGYLALAVGDATARLPLRIEEARVTLSTEGTVTVARSRDVVPPDEAAGVLRGMLAKLLDRSAGTMPGLTSAARARVESDAGIDGVVQEIEAALIPVNRAAAKRALARLARETVRAKEAGLLARGPERAAPVVRITIEPAAPAATEQPEPAPRDEAIAPAPLLAEEPARRPAAQAGLDAVLTTSETPPLPLVRRTERPAAVAVTAIDPPRSEPARAAVEEELPWVDDQPTTLDVVTAMRDEEPAPPSEPARMTRPFGFAIVDDIKITHDEEPAPPSERARMTQPFGFKAFDPVTITRDEEPAPPSEPARMTRPFGIEAFAAVDITHDEEPAPPSEPARMTRPFGIEVFEPALAVPLDTPTARPVGVGAIDIVEAAPPAEEHVETLPMRFELGHAKLGPEAFRSIPSVAEVAVRSAEPEAAAAPLEQPRAQAVDVRRAAPTSEAPRAQAADVPRPAPASEAPRARAVAVAPAKPRDVADLAASPKSDVDDLLASFGRSAVEDERAIRAVAASLKAIAELDPTALPPAVALGAPRAPAPAAAPRAPARPAPTVGALPGRRLSEPRKPSRAGLALSIVLLLAGLIATGLLWQYRPGFFTGRSSPLLQPQDAAQPAPPAAPGAQKRPPDR